MTWISFRNFHINLAAKPAKLSMPPPYTEYQSDCVCVCVLGLKYDLLARKAAGDLLVMSWHVSSASGQKDVRCGLWKAAIAVRQRGSPRTRKRKSKSKREGERVRQVKSKTEWSSHAAAMSIHFAVSTCSECEHLHLKASAPPLCPYPWLPLHKLVL